MKRITVITTILFLIITNLKAQSNRQILEFEFEGVLLNGVLNLPKDQKPKGIVLIIHGSGRTDYSLKIRLRDAIQKSRWETGVFFL